MKIPDRICWAVDLLRINSGKRVLEIGCGRGFAARALTPSLGVNGYVGIDRSKVAIQAARKLNGAAEGLGIARFSLGELGVADVGSRLFDVALAINVNAFWTDEGEAAATVQPLMKTKSRMLLVYELPSSAQLGEVEARLERNMRAGGFGLLNAVRPVDRAKPWIAMWAHKR